MNDPGEIGFAQVLLCSSGKAWRKCDADRAEQCAQGPDVVRIRAQRTRQRSQRYLDPSTSPVGSPRGRFGRASIRQRLASGPLILLPMLASGPFGHDHLSQPDRRLPSVPDESEYRRSFRLRVLLFSNRSQEEWKSSQSHACF